MQKKKQEKVIDDDVKPRKTFSLSLTKYELIHLRDLFSIVLPPDMKSTVSEALAFSQQRALVETKLWQKISQACSQAQIPVDDAAPDFIISPTGSPPMSVFELAHDPAQQDKQPEQQVKGVFDDEEK